MRGQERRHEVCPHVFRKDSALQKGQSERLRVDLRPPVVAGYDRLDQEGEFLHRRRRCSRKPDVTQYLGEWFELTSPARGPEVPFRNGGNTIGVDLVSDAVCLKKSSYDRGLD